jgi:pilus assembly protein CpaB
VRRNNVVILAVAVGMGLMAAFLARNWLRSARDATAPLLTSTIVVAVKPLAFGAALAGDDVAEIPWATSRVPDGAFVTKNELFKDGNRFLLTSLARNEPVLRPKITEPGQRASLSSLLEDGRRAVTVRVDDVRGVAGFIRPGDFVDIVLIAEEGAARRENYSEVLLQHVKVLAVDQLASESQEKPSVAKAVTLEVTPVQAQKILLASNIGKLSLILRRSAETSIDPSQRVTERDLGNGLPLRAAPTPVAPPTPPAATTEAASPITAKVTIVRNLKREDYAVVRIAK